MRVDAHSLPVKLPPRLYSTFSHSQGSRELVRWSSDEECFL